MTDEQLEAVSLALLPYVFREAAEAYGLAAPDGCTHPEPETLPSQDPMKMSLAASLDQSVSDTLSDARADLALLGMLPLSAAERDLAEPLHGALAHALHLAARLRDLTEAGR